MQKKRRKYGEAWKDIEIDAASNDAVFDKFLKQPIAQPPSRDEPPSQNVPAPLRDEPARDPNPLAPRTGSDKLLSPREAHLRFPYEVLDQTLGKVDPLPRVVLLRLYRLAAGFDSRTCHVSIGKLVSHCRIKETKMRECLRTLESDGYIRRVSVDVSHKNNEARGITFEVLLPRISSTKEANPPRETNPLAARTPSPREPNKENTLKETHTNTTPVSVCSRFSLQECRKYADSLKSEGIQNPGGYATKIYRSGEADELIERFLKPKTASIDVKQCPDCEGRGLRYIDGDFSKGVEKCSHPKLFG